MTDPRRWLEDPSTSAELLRVLGSAAAPPRLPEGVHALVGEYAAKLSAQSALAKVGGTSVLHALLATGGKAVGVVSLLGAVGLGAYAHRQASSHSTTDAPVLPSQRDVAHAVGQIPRPPAFDEVKESAPVQLRADVPASSARRLASADATSRQDHRIAETAAAATGVPESGLPAEAKLLETARSFLGDSPALALELTERHQRAYPNGQLGAEREFIAIAALLGLGRRQEAEHRAAPALTRAPDSLYARRLRGLLDGKQSARNRQVP